MTIQETYSSKLVNYVEEYVMGDNSYTRFYTELNTELNVGDFVYVLNGNYDNGDIIDTNEYQYGSNGYKVLLIDNNSIVLDIPFRGESVWNVDKYEDFTKVFVVDNLSKFYYENASNNHNKYALSGSKYNTLNNNIFLSNIELPLTNETQNKGKFFKSESIEPQLILTNTRGQIINSNNSLNFDLEEVSFYSIGNSIGLSGSNSININSNYTTDIELINNSSNDYLYTLSSVSEGEFSYIWEFNKRTMATIYTAVADIEDNQLSTPIFKSIMGNRRGISTTITLPANATGEFNYLTSGGEQVLLNEPYDISSLSETFIIGYEVPEPSTNLSTVGFYNRTNSPQLPLPNNEGSVFMNTSTGYSSGTTTNPYYILSGTFGTYNYPHNNLYFPKSIGEAFVVPSYASFTGIGRVANIDTNYFTNSDISDNSSNLEIVILGRKTTENDPSFDGENGGLYMYSYASMWKDYIGELGNDTFLGNGFEISKSVYDKYEVGIWNTSRFNPFENIDSYDVINSFTDIKFIGVEKKELGLGITYQANSSNIIVNKDGGVYYSKYLISTDSGDMYFLYSNFNQQLLANSPAFLDEMENGFPQVHIVFEKITDNVGIPVTQIGFNADNSSVANIISGEYPLVSLSENEVYSMKLSNNNLDTFNFTSNNFQAVSNISMRGKEIVLSSSAISPRFRFIEGNSSNGIRLFKKFVDGYSPIDITSSYQVLVGDALPSNGVFKTLLEEINGVKRLWAATDNGLYLLEYEYAQNENIYYSVDVDNNKIPLDSSIFKNNRLLIIEPFSYDGIEYKKGDVYKYSPESKVWIKDTTYSVSYISKSHFELGSLYNSTFNDGIFGNTYTDAVWDDTSSVWRNGILYNSTWEVGQMQSKSDTQLKSNNYANLLNGQISLSMGFDNNSGFGYNYIIGSLFKSGRINNANSVNSTIGEDNGKYLDTIYTGGTYSHTDISIDNLYTFNTDVVSTIIDNSVLEQSNISKSLIQSNTSILNTSVYDSKVQGGRIDNKGDITIINYDKWGNLRNNVDTQDVIQIHKFFISEEDYMKLDFMDSLILNRAEVNNNPTNILDRIFFMLGGEDGYYKDVYENLNSVIADNYSSDIFRVLITKRSRNENKYSTSVRYNGELVVDEKLVTNPEFSIDIEILIDTIEYGSSASEYLSIFANDAALKFRVNDISNTTIQRNHFNNSWINGGEWIDGSIMNPTQLSTHYGYGTVSSVSSGTPSLNYDFNNDYEILSSLVSSNSTYWINNTWDDSLSVDISGSYKMGTTYSNFEPYNTSFTYSQVFSNLISDKSFINSNRIDGVNNSLIFRKGIFKNQYFKNATLYNPSFKLTDLGYTNIRSLYLLGSEISVSDNVIVKNGYFAHGHFTSDYVTSSNTKFTGIGYKQTFNNVEINDSYLIKSAFLGGNFNSGIFIDSRYNSETDLIPINNAHYQTNDKSLVPAWHDGNFNDGNIIRSVWLKGTFNKGNFNSSEFLGGTWNGGNFGDTATPATSNIFRSGTWNGGNFRNGVFGNNPLYIRMVNSIYTIYDHLLSPFITSNINNMVWNGGTFNNGILTSSTGFVTIWNNGTFNNGQIIGDVIWKGGTHNNGRFKSSYGRHLDVVWGEYDFTSVSITHSGGELVFEYGATYSSFLNSGNISTIRDIYSNSFDSSGTLLLDTGDNQLKYAFLSLTNSLTDVFDEDGSVHGIGEQYIKDYENSLISKLYVRLSPVDKVYTDSNKNNKLKFNNSIASKIFIQNTKATKVYDGAEFIDINSFIGATISNTSFTYSSVYAWENGTFNNGEFGSQNNENNINPSWENGTFNDGKFYGKIWANGTFIKGQFNGSGASQSQTSLSNIYKGFDPLATTENYIGNVDINIITPQVVEQAEYQKTIFNNWYGLWLSGDVSPSSNNSPQLNAQLGIFNSNKYGRPITRDAIFNNVLWVDGTFNNPDAQFNQSVWLSGKFSNGVFNNSIFNPFIQRWDYLTGDLDTIIFSYDKDTTNTIWLNGTFNNGIFFYSNWENGTFEYGTMVGSTFKKGVANYLSAFSVIWESGRFRNGNWYGSSFTTNNVYNNDSIPNPFEYLGAYYENVANGAFITDILVNNSARVQDDRLYVWNMLSGASSISSYDLSAHNLGKDIDNVYIPGLVEEEYRASLDNTSVISSKYELLFKSENLNTQQIRSPYNFNLLLTDSTRYSKGTYQLILTSGALTKWKPFSGLSAYTMTILYDVFENGSKKSSDNILTTITTSSYNTRITTTFKVDVNQEYSIKLRFRGTSNGDNFTDTYYLSVNEASIDLVYKNENNTLGGSIIANWDSDYLISDANIITDSSTYTNIIGETITVNSSLYENSINIPSDYDEAGGVYAQYGNGAFLKGIFENGVWNNGYRGTEFGTYITDIGTVDTFTYSNGTTANVSMNQLYTNNTRYRYRTEPVIYFNNVQRAYKTNSNTWEIVLESALNIEGSSANNYNKLSIGDQVSVGNIVGIDINKNRKLIKDVFTVKSIPQNTQIVLEYIESFPVDTIDIDSDRHLIYVSKNIWLNGAYLNGMFEGIMNNGFIRGNRETTILKDSHIIQAKFEGGRFISTKYDLVDAFDTRVTNANSISPQFSSLYNDKYHSGVIQDMKFVDSVTIATYSMISPQGLEIKGQNGDKLIELGIGATTSVPESAIQYIYNSDIDVVYEPEFFSSIFNQNIVDNNILGKSLLRDEQTYIYNVPAGYITYDILSSKSKFRYSLSPTNNSNIIDYDLELGSKYKVFNDIYDVDFSKSPNNDPDIDPPSSFSILNSGSYSLYNKELLTDGVSFGPLQNQFIHEQFMYTYGDNDTIISGNNGFKTRGRYHLVEVDAEIKYTAQEFINPYNIDTRVTISSTYSYSDTQLPKLTIGQGYNEFYESEGASSYISPYDNDFLPYFDGRKQSEINNFSKSDRLTMKSFMYNNFGGYRDSVKVFEKGFGSVITGPTSSGYTVESPIYYSLKHYEVDKIPFFNYKDYNDPITGDSYQWNTWDIGDSNQSQTRIVDSRVKVPLYATSIPIDYDDSNFVLTDNINFIGGTNIVDTNIVVDESVFISTIGQNFIVNNRTIPSILPDFN